MKDLHFLALDGGGTGCRAMLCAADGRELGRAIGGGFTGVGFATAEEAFAPGGGFAPAEEPFATRGEAFAPGSGSAFPAKALTASAPTKAFAMADLTIVANTTQLQGSGTGTR